MSIGKFRFAWAWLIGAVLLTAPVRADVVDSSDFKIPQVTVDPTGACINGASYIQTTSSHLWVCGLAGWIDVTGTGTGGSTTALDNLASVNINSALLAQSGIDLGSTTQPFRNLYLYGGGTYSTTYLKLTGTPTSTRTLTIPDLTGTFLVQDGSGAGNGVISAVKSPSGASQTSNFLNITGTQTPVSASTWGAYIKLTGGGSASQESAAVNVEYLAGYTGGASNYGLRVAQFNAGTGAIVTNYDGTSNGPNGGILSRVVGTTAGSNAAGTFQASGGNENAALVADATTTKASSFNWGAIIRGRDTTGTGATGAYIGNDAGGTDPTAVNSTLQLNNSDQAYPILVAQDNGTTVKTIEDGGAEWGKMSTKTLTESSATLFVRVGVPSNGRQGGVVEYCVDANDATDYQERCGSVPFSGSNKGGTETCAVGTPSDVVTETQGASTLTVSFDTETAGTNTCGIRANAASSLVQTTLRINYTVRMFGNAATAVTPQ